MTVKIDIIDGTTIKQTFGGYETERIAIVTGLTGDGHTRLYNALNTAGVPEYGDAHPTIPSLTVQERSGSPDAADIVRIRLVYRTYTTSYGAPPEGTKPLVEVGTALVSMNTSEDVNGTVVTVSYGTAQTQTAVIPVDRPHTVIRLTRTEYYDPTEKSAEYTGKVNMAGWEIAPSSPARTWRCNGITGRSSDGEVTYAVTYEFEYKEDIPSGNWDVIYQYTDPITGTTPGDVVEGTGRKTVQVYTMANFNNLNLKA